jgi:hypothetical protein
MFEDVDEGPAPFAHSFGQHAEVTAQKDHRGRFLGDVDGCVHREADIGGVKQRRVVNPVAKVTDNMAFAPQGRERVLGFYRSDERTAPEEAIQ